MHNNSRKKILVIDDTIDHIKLLISQLEDLYDVYFAKSGKQALEILPGSQPDLILLDITMPEMDGFEVCKKIKAHDSWKEIPVIFISARGQEDDETNGLELGAIDYITKPFTPAIIRARIKNHLQLRDAMRELERLYGLALDANPVTGLPGNNTIARQIEQVLQDHASVCVLYADIDNFKPFNDRYGFARGDEIIRFTAEVLKSSAERSGCSEFFLGHVGGDDFILIAPSGESSFISHEIIRCFDRDVISFYNRQDASNRCIKATNRKGEEQFFPIMSLSIAGIDLANRNYTTYLEVNDACAEMKSKAKAMPGSTICFDRRKD
jgi:PleD family two-component response regulator